MRPGNAAIFKQPSGQSHEAENIDNLPDKYYDNLAQGKDEEFIKIYVGGEYGFIIEGKPVYPEYRDNVHCKPCSPIKGKPIRRGWDIGLTPACTFTQMLPSGQWIIFDEITSTRMGVDRFSDDVLAHCSQAYSDFKFTDTGDPVGESTSETDEKTCFKIPQAKGINIEAGEQTPTIRVESVKKPLNTMVDGMPGLIVDPKCQMIRRGFMGGYQFAKMRIVDEKYHEKLDKNAYSHPHDALQYDATRLFASGLTESETDWGSVLEYDDAGIV